MGVNAKYAWLGLALQLAVLCPLTACSTRSDKVRLVVRDPSSIQSRERTLNSRWRNQPYSALVNEFGEPRTLMTIPGHGAKQVAVYGVLDFKTHCIDAFALQPDPNGERVVVDYFCR